MMAPTNCPKDFSGAAEDHIFGAVSRNGVAVKAGSRGARDPQGTDDHHGTDDRHGTQDRHRTNNRNCTDDRHGTQDRHGTHNRNGTQDRHGTDDRHGTQDRHGIHETRGTDSYSGDVGTSHYTSSHDTSSHGNSVDDGIAQSGSSSSAHSNSAPSSSAHDSSAHSSSAPSTSAHGSSAPSSSAHDSSAHSSSAPSSSAHDSSAHSSSAPSSSAHDSSAHSSSAPGDSAGGGSIDGGDSHEALIPEETVFGDISSRPRNVICIVVQGLTAGTLSAAPAVGGSRGLGQGGRAVATPNLEVLASIGVTADFCAGAQSSVPADVLAEILTEGRVSRWDAGDAGAEAIRTAAGDGWLPSRADSRGKLWLSVLPRTESSWPAGIDDGSASCTIVADVSPRRGDTPMDWDDLSRVSPRAVIRNTEDDGFMRSAIEERVLSRFPGPTSRAMHGGAAAPSRAALDSWVEWLGDAFIRSVWFSMDRPGGTAALLYHPAPEVYAALYGPEGYRWAVEQVDDLAGRLLMLAEHDQMGDLAFIVTGDRSLPALTGTAPEADAAGGDAGGHEDDPGVPVLAAAPGIDPGSFVSYCTFADVSRLMGACL